MSDVKAEKHDLEDKFKIKGLWWLPDSDKKVAGFLYYSSEKIELELNGSFNEQFIHTHEVRVFEYIHGMSNKGEMFTLIKVMERKSNISYPGYDTGTYGVDKFITGGYFKSEEELYFNSIEFNTTHLTTWLQKQPFKTNYTLDKNRVKERHMIYTPPEKFEVDISLINAKIKESYIANFSRTLNVNEEWNFTSYLELVPRENKHSGWFLENIKKIKDLLSLFVGNGINFKSIKFKGPYDAEWDTRKTFSLFITQGYSINYDKDKRENYLIEYKEAKDSLGKLFNNWFEKQDKLETIINLHLSKFYKESYIETTFLESVQTLEIYHRKVYNTKYFDEELYTEHSSKVIDYIASNIPEELHERLFGLLEHGNEYSLNKRLKELLNKFQPSTLQFILGKDNSKSKKRFVNQLVDTRNYLTHYELGSKKNVLMKGEDKYYASEKIRLLVTILLYKEIGFDEQSILTKLKIFPNCWFLHSIK
ncbi:hypothetical protein CR205_11215 [Alteribacter lacisalsi]|uniref:ApeA N-terminal domain-containing protein n=1 Tax=Alteribacter lacisalsi TaxID=2045244 RepID=A0A2W0HDU9_9BACI|nr:HEPN domain-containing protein [Alteribacter lacisalsi]PYZ99096.1 hypothetical protein CR205_11215 [Alteribacter lacisalsi]